MSDLDPELGIQLVNQEDLESSLTNKANKALLSKEAELDEKRLTKAVSDLDKSVKRVRLLQLRLENPRTKISQRKSLRDEIEWLQQNELKPRQQDVDDIQSRLKGHKDLLQETQTKPPGTNEPLPDESERDFLIRTGKITAFGSSSAFVGDLLRSSQRLRAPGFANEEHTQKTPLTTSVAPKTEDSDILVNSEPENLEEDNASGSEYSQKEEESDDDVVEPVEEDLEDLDALPAAVSMSLSSRNQDDGDESVYQLRLQEWVQRRSLLRRENQAKENPNITLENESDLPEWQLPHPSIPDAVLDSQFRLPGDVFPSLFDYQKTCVQWLWELYSQKTGGIMGDEMGLGKTIQVIAFLAGLHHSGILEKPVLLVVPATVMNQWVNEFHKWWPPLRCVILHSIGSGMSKSSIKSEAELEASLEMEEGESMDLSVNAANNQINAKEIIDRVIEKGHVLVTTYVGLRIYSKHILPHEWGYTILDEGHKIRNPNSEISLACKRIKTYNRIILSGTPIQNNLIELWSLFDFVFPGRLGTLPVFEQQFAIPINMGGYANATNVQVQTGYKCAVILRDLISPYLLRRLKADVAQDLPKKNEMVLFVKLTQFQQNLYEKFLQSEDVSAIIKGRRNVLMGVDMLRKICNHPDLIDRDALLRKSGYNYGNPSKSGKMQVLKNLLQLWQNQGHRTLLFCQTKQMLDILEKFIANLRRVKAQDDGIQEEDYFHYLRMDGSTNIGKRQQLVDSFNNNTYFDVFLLTTKVGGLGVNLTGADRVIIFDPDWNPSTDIQARERAWRLGQTKDITIYRLMTAGTIEEKIYHRQIFKTFLTNKILKDPKQRRFFKLNDLHDLFSLGDPEEKGTETGDMFNGSEKVFLGNKERKSQKLMKPQHKNDDDFYQVANIMGVSKLGNYEGGDEDDEQKEGGQKDKNRLMEGIFSNAGVVHSTLQHDDIVDSSKHEMSIVEKEANQVAKEAAEALKMSRIQARKTEVGTPTWTGKFGLAGRFGPKKRARGISPKFPSRSASLSPQKSPGVSSPLSSASILTELRQRKADGPNTAGAQTTGPKTKTKAKTRTITSDDKQKLLSHLVDFLQSQPDKFSKSDAILKSLPKSVDLKNEKNAITVRALLREAADWRPAEKGWLLKDSLRE